MSSVPAAGLNRRRFLHVAAAVAAASAGSSITLISCGEPAPGPEPGPGSRSALPVPATLSAVGATLIAGPGLARIAPGESSAAWLFNDMMPGPTIRARRGEQAQIRLVNQLTEPTIVHWHGLIVPEEADGHPRRAIQAGATLDYRFPVVQRAGTFWYHPHPHSRTAAQIHRGLAGFFIISDEEEDSLGLPRGEREILLLLQDRDGDAGKAFDYAPSDTDLHAGMLRNVPFGNGARMPSLNVIGGRYRFRVLNGSQARVYRLGLSNGAPFSVIGNDGGLLPSVAQVDSVFLGVGERVDLLVDFASVKVGSRLMLKSLPFEMATTSTGGFSQGAEMDLLELVRTEGAGGIERPLPATLSNVAPLGAAASDRAFLLRSTNQKEMHLINGVSFDMDRIDERIPLGKVERWIFLNDSPLPHPVHLHGTQFQVESRVGGRNTVYPYEGGWKDTVLLMPLEKVTVLVRFDRYRGVFPLHCHNLQHEDLGMMLNVEVT